MQIDYGYLLHSMYPTCVFSCREYDYEGITWSENNDIPKPSKEELTSEWEKEWQNCHGKNYVKLVMNY